MVADTYSNTLGYLIMGTGNDNNVWGSNANSAVFQILEDAIANVLTSTVTGGTLDLSGSPPPAAASQVRYAALIFNGTLGSAQSIKVPNLTKFWLVQNATSGAYALTFKTPSGSASTAIPQNSGWQLIECDGADNIVVSPFNSVQAQMPDGSAAAPPYTSVSETNSGWYRHGTQDWRLSINGVDVLQATGTGAGTASVLNVLTPNIFQVNGKQLSVNWVAAGGTADALTATYSPSVGSLTDGLICFVRASAANATTTPTFAPNGLTAHTITKKGGAALAVGDITAALAELILIYNLANTRWELLNLLPVTYSAGNNLTLTGTSFSNPAVPMPAAFKNLSIKVASTTTVTCAADYITVNDGTSFLTLAFSGTLDLGSNGALNKLDAGTIAIDTWYAVYAIAKADGTLPGFLASTSFTSPALPSGYTLAARVGAVQTIHATATLYGSWQLGRRFQYVVGLASTSTSVLISAAATGNVTTPGWTAIAVARFVPPTASIIYMTAHTGNVSQQIVAPNSSYGGYTSGTNQPFTGGASGAGAGSGSFDNTYNVDFMLESTNIYYASTSTGNQLLCRGYEDNI